MPATHRVLHDVTGVPVSAGLVVWLDATQLTGLADGAALASWPDESGHGNTFSQATGADQPLYHSTTSAGLINGKPAVQFDGVDDYMSIAAFAQAQPYTFIAVFKNASTVGNTEILSSNANGVQFVGRATLNVFEISAGSAVNVGVWDTALHYLAGVYHGVTSTAQQDGTVSTGDANTQSMSGALGLGTDLPGLTAFLQGLLGELLVYNRALSATELNQMRTYAQGKWGTP